MESSLQRRNVTRNRKQICMKEGAMRLRKRKGVLPNEE